MSVTTDIKVTVSGSSDTLVDGYTFVSGDWDVTLAATEGDDTGQFEALLALHATLDATEGDDAADFVAALSIGAEIDATEGDDVAAFEAELPLAVTLEATEGDDAAAFEAAQTIQVTADASEADDTAAFESTVHTTVEFAASEEDDTASFPAIHDWTVALDVDAQIYYTVEVQNGGDKLRMPISSWQATLQTGRKSFVQAVVPAAEQYIDELSALRYASDHANRDLPNVPDWEDAPDGTRYLMLNRDYDWVWAIGGDEVPYVDEYLGEDVWWNPGGSFEFAATGVENPDWRDTLEKKPEADLVVIRGARNLDGSELEADMARVPLGQMPYQRGPRRSTVTLSGYGDISFQAVEDDEAVGAERTLAGVQTLSTQGGTRARSEVDWVLRPGMQAIADDQQFQVSYINYYVNNTQEFMEVGERTL